MAFGTKQSREVQGMLPQENLNFENLRNIILWILARFLTSTEALITRHTSIIIDSDPPLQTIFGRAPTFEAIFFSVSCLWEIYKKKHPCSVYRC